MSLETTGKKILVFLPPPAAEKIVGHLSGLGYVAVAVSTVPEAFDALRSNEFSLAIATRLDISLLRHIRTIPVINMEIFFHADPALENAETVPKRLDSRAFVARVEYLSRSAASRSYGHGATREDTVAQEEDFGPGLWGRIKRFWQLRRGGEALSDVRG